MPDEFSIPERRPLVRLFPALRLVGAIRQAFDFRKLLIAALGLAIFQAGWTLLDRLVPAAADTTPALLSPSLASNGPSEPNFWSSEALAGLHYRLSEPFRLLATPLFALLEPGAGWLRMLHATSSVIWLIVVWSICGGAIARIAIVQAAAMQQTGIIAAMRFALAKSRPLIMAPLCPLVGVVFLAVFCGIRATLPRAVGRAHTRGHRSGLPARRGIGDDLARRRPGGRLAPLARRDGQRSRRRP